MNTEHVMHQKLKMANQNNFHLVLKWLPAEAHPSLLQRWLLVEEAAAPLMGIVTGCKFQCLRRRAGRHFARHWKFWVTQNRKRKELTKVILLEKMAAIFHAEHWQEKQRYTFAKRCSFWCPYSYGNRIATLYFRQWLWAYSSFEC